MSKSAIRNTALIVGGVLLAVAVAVIGLLSVKYAFVGGKLYPRDQYVFDLRGQDISLQTYEKLEKKLPGSWIVWDVPFQDSKLASDTKELTVTHLTDADVELLDYLPQLKTVYAEDCTDWPQLVELQKRHGTCRVAYTIPIGEFNYPSDTERLVVPELTAEEAYRLEYLLHLNSVDATGSLEYDVLEELKQKHPEWNLVYAIQIRGESFSRDAQSINPVGGTYAELFSAFKALTELNNVMITDPDASGAELVQLQQEYPNINLRWKKTVNGIQYADDITELDLTGHPVQSVAEAEEIASYFPKLEKLILGELPNIDNEAMAAFREAKRSEYKVVWTVRFTEKCIARTDDTIFMPIKQAEYYFKDSNTTNLKYLEDMVCMDIGHAPVRNIEFLKYMPHLKYLILAHTDVRDIAPISNCKELIYLELDSTPSYPSYEPLVALTKLEDLNLGDTYCDPAPLYQMTWLKHLWIVGRKDAYTIRTTMEEKVPGIQVYYGGDITVGGGWRNLPNYYAMRDMLGMEYMKG